MEDDEKQDSIRTFCNEFLLFLEKNEIEKIYIKKRAKKGTFAREEQILLKLKL